MTLSRIFIVFTIFIVLTFSLFSFYLGLEYQKQFGKSQLNEKIAEKIIEVPKGDASELLIKRCGYIPDPLLLYLGEAEEHFLIKVGPVWAPDCRHMAWSYLQSGTGWLGEPENEGSNNLDMVINIPPAQKEGVYLYNDRSMQIQKIYEPKTRKETPELIGWKDRNSLSFSIATESGQRRELIYDLSIRSLISD